MSGRHTCRPTVDRLSIDYRPSVDGVSGDCRSIVDRVATECRSSIDRVSTATAIDMAGDITYNKHDPVTNFQSAKNFHLK